MERENRTTEAAGRAPGERAPTRYEEDGIGMGEHVAILRRSWRKILFFSIGIGCLTLGLMYLIPNQYLSTAVITNPVNGKKINPALGALLSSGIDIGMPSKVEDLETLFRSNDLSVRVFRKYNIWKKIFPDKFDSVTGKMKAGWTGRLIRGEKETRIPSDWDAIRAAKDLLKVSVNKRNGTISLSFESPSGEDSATILKYYLDEGKSRLQEEAFDRAFKNKKFIEEQISKTVDALTRDRLYALYGQEVEQEMMARNREQFGFRVIDEPRVPDRKYRPRRTLSALMAATLAFFFSCLYFVLRENPRKIKVIRET